MKLETYLLVDENSIVGNFETITDACDFIRNVTIRQCVEKIPNVCKNGSSESLFISKEEVISKLKDCLPHYTIRKLINIKGYETSDTLCD